ncbi:MAG: DUF131 domain-containing protein [Candidatus Thorarchaeota archaeon]
MTIGDIMIAQNIPQLEFIAYGIITLGIIIVLIGFFLMNRSAKNGESGTKMETKAIVFIGPIPLVWGFSRKTQGILCIVALAVLITWFLFFF